LLDASFASLILILNHFQSTIMFNKILFPFVLLTTFLFAVACNGSSAQKLTDKHPLTDTTRYGKLDTAYFASGCFWCVEAVYEHLYGVKDAISGYAGGRTKNPTYEQVGSGQTGHAEALAVFYDPKLITYETLVKVYFASQNPTQVNGQGPDNGSAYRSIIFYRNATEQKTAETQKKTLGDSGKYSEPIAAEILPFEAFYNAEDYHQNYERLHPDNPYVQRISVPRLRKFEALFPELLKK
jgi:peptide-methionine (S)-S-oxide reductase